MSPINCFLMEDAHQLRRWLRRFVSGDRGSCPHGHGYHNAMVLLDEVPATETTLEWPRDDSRWPTKCECGYEFTPADEWQLFRKSLWRAPHGLTTIEDAPVGAMFYADWVDWRVGPDGKVLHVIVPPHHVWNIDGTASNCDSPCARCGVPYHAHRQGECRTYEDSQPDHRCWVRHGTPPAITVDKSGKTCNAGGGSISVPGWHGFLRAGQLVE